MGERDAIPASPFPENFSIPAILMKTHLVAFALSATLFCARADEVIDGELFYHPPQGYSFVGPSSADPSVVRKYVSPENTPANHREISFGFLLPDDPAGLGDTRNLTFLGKKLREKLASPRIRDLSDISETTVGGKPAIHASYRMTIPEYPEMPALGMHVYWIPAARDQVIQILLTTTPADKLPELRGTLKSIRFEDPVKAAAEAPVPASTGKVSLGDERSAVYKACGKPATADSSHDIYFMEPFVTVVNYNMPHVNSIHYFLPTDAKKLVTAIGAYDKDAIPGFAAPLKPENVQAILARHAPEPDAWKAVGENRWERADGAVAFHWVKRNLVVLATRETWPKLTFPE